MLDDPAVDAANDLAASLRDMTTQFAGLKTYGHTNRRLIWLTIVSVILDVALSVAVVVIATGQAHSNDTFRRSVVAASTLKAATLAACEAGNESRAQQRAIWATILEQPNATGPLNATLKHQVAVAYAPRNCQKIYGSK